MHTACPKAEVAADATEVSAGQPPLSTTENEFELFPWYLGLNVVGLIDIAV
jgi:hypothetical protein